MAGTVDEKWLIDKLDSSNQTTWKFPEDANAQA